VSASDIGLAEYLIRKVFPLVEEPFSKWHKCTSKIVWKHFFIFPYIFLRFTLTMHPILIVLLKLTYLSKIWNVKVGAWPSPRKKWRAYTHAGNSSATPGFFANSLFQICRSYRFAEFLKSSFGLFFISMQLIFPHFGILFYALIAILLSRGFTHKHAWINVILLENHRSICLSSI